MMGNCKDCRFWRPTPADGGICLLASWPDEKPTGQDGLPILNKATAIGASGRGTAALVTAPDFGCVQFDAKPQVLEPDICKDCGNEYPPRLMAAIRKIEDYEHGRCFDCIQAFKG